MSSSRTGPLTLRMMERVGPRTRVTLTSLTGTLAESIFARVELCDGEVSGGRLFEGRRRECVRSPC